MESNPFKSALLTLLKSVAPAFTAFVGALLSAVLGG